jgi:hypothetical protein
LLALPTKNDDGVDQTDVHCALRFAFLDVVGGVTAIESRRGWNRDADQLYLESGVIYLNGMENSD